MGTMVKRLSVIVGILVALSTVVTDTAAVAAGGWVAVPGGRFIANAGQVTLTSSFAITCTSSRAVGTLSPVPAVPIGTIPMGGLTFTGCAAAGFPFSVIQVGSWDILAGPHDGTTASGSITKVNLRLSSSFCTATATGTLNFSHTNAGNDLTVTTSSLTITAVSGCLGLITVGEHPTVRARYVFDPSTPQMLVPAP